MLVDFRIIAACCAVIVGSMVAWANPVRRLNRMFLVFSFSVAIWLFCQWRASQSDNGLWWVRMACATGVGVVLIMWLVKETAAGPEKKIGYHLRLMLPWIVAGIALAWICFTPYFVPSTSTGFRRLYGWGYFLYVFSIAAIVLGIFVRTLFQMRALSGVRRLELQLLLLGSIAAALAVVCMMILGAATGNSAFNRAQAVFVFAFYVVTSWAIATTRVLDAHYMLLVGLSKLLHAGMTTAFGWMLYQAAVRILPEIIALIAVIGVGLWFAAFLEPVIRRELGLNRSDEETRRAAYEAARSESRPERLETAFVRVLRSWASSHCCLIRTH